MRITGGKSKGKVLAPFKGLHIRPTSDLVREAIFNILGHDLEKTVVLDLFSGTGILGLEALSRGAAKAVFVDNSPRSISIIKKNLTLCGAKQYGLILKKDLKKGVSFLTKLPIEKYDLIFLDPPYSKGLAVPVVESLLKNGLMSCGARLVVETSKFEKLPDRFDALEIKNIKTYGDTKIHFYIHGVVK